MGISWVLEELCYNQQYSNEYQLSVQCMAGAGDDLRDYVLNLIRFELD